MADRSEADLQDELETAVNDWEYAIREVRGHSDPIYRKIVVDAPPLLIAVRRAAKRDPEATWATLRLGLLMGLWQMNPYPYHLRRTASDRQRGERVKAGAAKGGRETSENARRDPRRARAVALVERLHQLNSGWSYTYVCARVGRELEPKLSGRQIQRITESIRWSTTKEAKA